MRRISAQQRLDRDLGTHYKLTPELIHHLTLVATEDRDLADRAKANATLAEE